MNDLRAQQSALSAIEHDIRITNLARFLHKRLPLRSGRLIDVGAGNGLLLKFFKKKGYVVEGVELEKEQVQRMWKDGNLRGVKIRQGDITKLTGDASYHVVIASDVIEHIKDDRLALSRLYSFVAPGGFLIITVPAHQYLFGKRDRAWGHFRRYNKSDLLNKIGELGGTLVFCGYWNLVGYFAYFFYERIRKKAIREDFRYGTSPVSRIVRWLLGLELRVEEHLGTPVGLTLVAIVRKKG